jgi:hypothetical protein
MIESFFRKFCKVSMKERRGNGFRNWKIHRYLNIYIRGPQISNKVCAALASCALVSVSASASESPAITVTVTVPVNVLVSVCLSVCLPACLSIGLVYLSFCLSVIC